VKAVVLVLPDPDSLSFCDEGALRPFIMGVSWGVSWH
jgi:hypothetical protein